MARLVPARPRFDTPAEERTVLTLERTLDDSHVVFQKRPTDGYLVAHPDRGLCLVTVASGAKSYDPDAEAFEGIDLDATALSVADEAGHPAGAAAFLADTPRTPGGMTDPRLVFAGEEDMLAEAVAAGMKASMPMGKLGVDALIQSLSPGASAYAADSVTDAQSRWRAERGATSAGGAAQKADDGKEAAALEGVEIVTDEPSGDGQPATTTVADSVDGADREDITDEHPLVHLLRQAVETVAGDKKMFVVGVQVSAIDATATDFLLPALLIAAAEDWAPIVASREGKGGFLIRLRTDKDALLGYRVVGLDPATPFLLMLPIVHKVRRSFRKGEYLFDDIVFQFTRWLAANRLDTEAVGDIDVRVALSI